MLDLPTKWYPVKLKFLESVECIYDKDALIKESRGLGLEGLNDQRLRDLFKTINENIPSNIKFEKSNDNLNASVDFGLKWIFKLSLLDPKETTTFLIKLNFQNYANVNYSQYQIEKLKDDLKVKDAYIRFLELNFKLSNGDEAILKYKKNNKALVNSLEKFNEDEWESNLNKEYANQKSKLSTKSNWKNDLENAISNDWIFANQDYTGIAKKLNLNNDNDKTKEASRSKKRKRSVDEHPAPQLQTNHNEPQGSITSPKKKKKIGQL
ncbi:uncharacterized protein KGF55_004328 [Candida pseudojiufengensis]|uniref:uncharacterized protein n=1 Tax=Candida pseudojiufengensis TaxID=497109 RepID=UPI002225117E|nr:uncharacterized protein KGF55_004328 [Candida pseudojiufengensis]KAI5960758.1 hypothetical protein KGF55_004328 [Candida pseudojiufengensis]